MRLAAVYTNMPRMFVYAQKQYADLTMCFDSAYVHKFGWDPEPYYFYKNILIRTLPGRRAQRSLIRCVFVGDYFTSKVNQIDESGAIRRKK